MNTCPNCNFQNPEEIHICLRCAASLNLRCANCGAELPANNRFCGQCGAAIQTKDRASNDTRPQVLASSQQTNLLAGLRTMMPANLATKIIQRSTEIVGQRREVTVVCVEITNYKQASQELDSERLYIAIGEVLRLLADIIYKYEGTIDQLTGSGVMALFGVPLNHENDPERAVRVSLEIQKAFNQIQARLWEHLQFEFQIGIGVNTGTILAGQLDVQNHLEYTVIGDTFTLAAKLRELCPPSAVLVSFSTYQRTRPIIRYLRMPPEMTSVTASSLQYFQPIDVRHAPGQARGLPGLQVPIVGRSEEILQLRNAINHIGSLHKSHIVLVSGEAGIGKTRLIAECRNAAGEQPIRFFQGTCAAYMRITPYRVVADILRTMVGISELDPDHIQRKALRQHLDMLGPAMNEVLPYLLQILGVLQSDPMLELRIKLLDPSMLQRQTHVALRSLLIQEAHRSPLVLVFDDMHWVDEASQQFLEYFCQTIDDIPILIILIARNFEQFELVQEIRAAIQKRSVKPVEISLLPLSREDSSLLVDQLIQDNSYRAEQLKSIIIQRADGNPYYTEELVRVMIDHGALVQHGGSWHVNSQASQLISQVPATLQDIILARYDLLPKQQQTMMQIAAVLGNTFSYSLFQEVIDTEDDDLTKGLMSWLTMAFYRIPTME